MNLSPFQNLQAQLRHNDTIPKGYKSANEIAEENGRGENWTREILRKGVKNGLVDRKEFVVNGRRTAYYKL